jgi:hypothetical protein
MVRQAHHLTTLSQVDGQITMTKIQNSKQLGFDIIEILNLFAQF